VTLSLEQRLARAVRPLEDPPFAASPETERMEALEAREHAAADVLVPVINRVGNAGIEVGSAQLTLAEARTHLTLARTEVHAFAPAKVEAVA